MAHFDAMTPFDAMASFDNATNRLLADQLNDKMKRAVMPVTVIVAMEIAFGFFGNLSILYVFAFRYHACNFRYFVLCLAITDITSCLTTMPGEIVTQLYWYVYPYPGVCKVKSFFNVLTVSSEALCLLTIAVDRYRKVCRPHGWQIRQHVAKWLCLAIYGTAFVLALPVAFYWGTHVDTEINNDGVSVTVKICEKDQKYMDNNQDQPKAYSGSIIAILSISSACMFVLYVLIARKLVWGDNVRRSRHAYRSPREDGHTSPTRNGMTSPSDVENNHQTENEATHTDAPSGTLNSREARVRRKTLIMFILTGTFIVTTTLYTVLLYLVADGILKTLLDWERAMYFFFFRLYFINHVINPFVYGFLDTNFRQTLLHCKRKITRGLSTSTS